MLQQQQQQQQQQHVVTPLQHSNTVILPNKLTNQFVALQTEIYTGSGEYDHLYPDKVIYTLSQLLSLFMKFVVVYLGSNGSSSANTS